MKILLDVLKGNQGAEPRVRLICALVALPFTVAALWHIAGIDNEERYGSQPKGKKRCYTI